MSRLEPQIEALSALKVIDRLEVGPVRVEPRRVRAVYQVSRQGGTDRFELVYRFAEEVFERHRLGALATLNLAAMMTAQVAVNYGLFCGEIVFRGPFDASDRRFLAEMTALTAREIFVRKLLRPKPFIDPWVQRLPALQLESYLLARLSFPEAIGDAEAGSMPPWDLDDERVALLCSGGKDSLLSHQLLHECGVETDPIFVNEAGRHWFTALNAYRHYAAQVANTARVWSNCDRVFAAMLRHLPFVRRDYHRYAWNGYPIRVWTVPVFLFGVLPLLRRRRAAGLAAGNEFDTTVHGLHEGIPHHFCLYDQSRDFDLYLNDYFRRKRWGVKLFSLLRPLSGLLIQKQLLRRYPLIQRLQMSCHRAHSDGERMRPCGTCEKCIGVMAMLSAFDGDPAACGYAPEQLARCLDELPVHGTWQEPVALRHLAFLLHEKGLLRAAMVGSCAAERCPEVMKLRFDGEHAALDDLPAALRRPLYRLLLEEAAGAVRLSGDEWVDFDLLQAAAQSDAAPPLAARGGAGWVSACQGR